MKSSIVRKLFLSILTIFLIVMAVQLIFQTFLIDDVYEITKSRHIEKAFFEVNESFMESENVNYSKFFDENDAAITYFTDEGSILENDFLQNMNYITVKDKNIIFDDLFDDIGDLQQGLVIERGQEVDVECIQIPGTTYYLGMQISGDGYEYYSDYSKLLYEGYYRSKEDKILIKGNIEALIGHERDEGISGFLSPRLLVEIINVCLEPNILNSQNQLNSKLYKNSLNYDFVDEQSGVHYMVMVAKLKGSNINAITIFEIQELGRAFAVINKYYYYIFGLQFLLIILLAFIYSRWFTRPLIELNKSAKAIASEDFTVKTSINTHDEIEELSENMNLISQNLSESIEGLKDKNNQLDEYANQKAEEEERMRNLLMDMSHEFKTPLGIISGFVEILEDGVGEKPKEYYLNSISNEIEGLDELVHNTLEMARLESGEYRLSLTEFNISELIKNITEKFKSQIDKKSQKLTIIDKSGTVNADYSKIQRVLSNLISNAIKYSPEGGKITLSANRESDGCKISVTNSGVNITKEEVERIFQRYYRNEKSRNRQTGGHGLGLSIVKNILELHGFEYGTKCEDDNLTVYFIIK